MREPAIHSDRQTGGVDRLPVRVGDAKAFAKESPVAVDAGQGEPPLDAALQTWAVNR